jgi:hypothetical protein|nr:MAG TPA: hypothetical protein [Caudoviricetes sp.]
MEQIKDISMYDNIIKNMVKKYGGYREKDIINNPYVIKKTETWNNEHKVLDIIEKNTHDHENSFSVDIVTMRICG